MTKAVQRPRQCFNVLENHLLRCGVNASFRANSKQQPLAHYHMLPTSFALRFHTINDSTAPKPFHSLNFSLQQHQRITFPAIFSALDTPLTSHFSGSSARVSQSVEIILLANFLTLCPLRQRTRDLPRTRHLQTRSLWLPLFRIYRQSCSIFPSTVDSNCDRECN